MCSKRSNRFFDLFDPPRDTSVSVESSYKSPGQQNRGLKTLAKHIDFTIDFHGYNVNQAYSIIDAHLKEHPEQHVCLFIHGKGLNTTSVLKRHILDYLTQHPRAYGYIEAPRDKGGSGATVVRFAKRH